MDPSPYVSPDSSPYPSPSPSPFQCPPPPASQFSSGRFRVGCVIRRYARVNCLFVFPGRGMLQDGSIPGRKVRLVAGPLAYRLAVAMRRASGRLGPRKGSRSRFLEEGVKWGDPAARRFHFDRPPSFNEAGNTPYCPETGALRVASTSKKEKWRKVSSQDLINAATGRISRFADAYFHSSDAVAQRQRQVRAGRRDRTGLEL